jgi:phage tail sheath protein FI
MPVNPTYPGLYIEELPSSAHTITPAPTSIAAFVGYTHPFQGEYAQNGDWGKARQIFNFTDYQRIFGGLYRSTILRSDVADAVYHFFLNGGTNAWVVGLQPRYIPSAGAPTLMTGATDTLSGIRFTSKQLTDSTNKVSVTIRNVRKTTAANDTADILITFGTLVEQYRNVHIAAVALATVSDPQFITKQLALSRHVDIAPATGTQYLSAFDTTTPVMTLDLWDMNQPGGTTTLLLSDFTDAFQDDSALDKLDIFNLLVVPGIADNGVWGAGLAFCERKRAFYIMDPPANAAGDDSFSGVPKIEDLIDTVPHASPNGALYFPYLLANDPISSSAKTVEQAPSGYVAGIYARTDTKRGVWKAPAGLETSLINARDVVEEGRITDMRQGTLNPLGVNVLRSFPGSGTVVWGARTVVTKNPAFEQWRYVPVRRMALFIEQTLLRNLGWVVFEPNDQPLWTAIRVSIEGFMLSLFRQAAFQGSTPSQAFRVQCDETTTLQTDIDNGIVNIVVGFRPLKPAEFVVIKIAQLAGQVQ